MKEHEITQAISLQRQLAIYLTQPSSLSSGLLGSTQGSVDLPTNLAPCPEAAAIVKRYPLQFCYLGEKNTERLFFAMRPYLKALIILFSDSLQQHWINHTAKRQDATSRDIRAEINRFLEYLEAEEHDVSSEYLKSCILFDLAFGAAKLHAMELRRSGKPAKGYCETVEFGITITDLLGRKSCIGTSSERLEFRVIDDYRVTVSKAG